MARILSPSAFGLFGIATMAATGLQVLADFGLRSVLIARVSPGDARTQRWVDTIWTLEVARGIVVACGIALSAGAIAAFFSEPDARRVAYILAFGIALTATVNVGLFLLERRLQFGRVVLVEQSAAAVGLAVAVATGLWLRSADALAWAAVASAATTVTLSFLLAPMRARPRVDPAVAKEALSTGGSLLVIASMTFLTTQFDNIVIGRLAGTETLGVYLVAYNLAMVPITVVGTIVTRVMLPDYSGRVLLDRDRALEYWAHTMRGIGWLLLAFALPMFLYGDFVVAILYGNRWAAAGQVLPVLALVGLTRGLARGASPMFLALGLQNFDAKAKVVETAVFVSLVLLLVGSLELGMIGAAWAGLGCYGPAAVLRLVFLSWRAPLAKAVLLSGLWRMLTAVLVAAAVSSVLTWAAGAELVTVVAVFVGVMIAGWFSEAKLRASVLQQSHVTA